MRAVPIEFGVLEHDLVSMMQPTMLRQLLVGTQSIGSTAQTKIRQSFVFHKC